MNTHTPTTKKVIAISLTALERPVSNKRAVQALRRAGRIPAVVYGRSAPLAISIDAFEFSHMFHHVSENTLIDIDINGQTRHVIVKDYSIAIPSAQVLHLDFLEIEKGKMLRTHIPVLAAGSSIGVRRGGVYEQPAHEIEIECLPQDLPQNIELDISNLDIGDSLHVSDLSLGESVRVISNPDTVLCHIATVRAVQVEPKADDESGEDDGAAASA